METTPAAVGVADSIGVGTVTTATAASDVPLSFESRRSEDKGKSQKVGAPKEVEQKGRIVSSKEEVSDFIRGKIDNGVCKKGKVIDGRQTYKFLKKDGMFEEGDLLTKDARHNEIEWWTQNGAHKGAEPKEGTQYKPLDSTKHLNTK